MESPFLTLPDEFGIGTKKALVYFYSNIRSSVKNKVVFTKNMICLLQHGVKEVLTAEGKEVVTNQDVLILTSGSSLMSESVAENGRYEAILVFFSNQLLAEFCVQYEVAIRQEKTRRAILKATRDEFLNHYCRSLQILKERPRLSMDEVKAQELLCYLQSKEPALFQQLLSQAFADRAEVRLRQVVESNTDKGLTVDELAFLCNMSPSTFKRHFAALYGLSPQKYFTQKKMEQAKTLLSLQKKASEIYLALGYEHLSAFSAEFKKYVGLSPKQYQYKIGRAEEVVEPFA